MERLDSKRIFFSLWPDVVVRDRLQQLLSILPAGQGQPHAVEDLHLTLVFIGQANAEYYQCLRRAAAQIRFSPFTFELARFGYFAKARVVSVEPSAVSSPLNGLAQALADALRVCVYKPDPRAYAPHVTLLRKVLPLSAPMEFEPILWSVDRFCLVESHEPKDGRRYKVLEEFVFNK